LSFSHPADARPAVLFHGNEVFHAVKISRDIFSFLLCSFLADGVSLIDVIDAANFQIMRAFMGVGRGKESKEGQEDNDQLHFVDE